MDTGTGKLFAWSEEEAEQLYEAVGQEPLTSQTVDRLGELSELGGQLEEAATIARSGGTIVPISPHVEHTMRIGQRELERRKRRRKAQREGRKLNR